MSSRAKSRDPVHRLEARHGSRLHRLRYDFDSAEFTLSERSESNGLRSE